MLVSEPMGTLLVNERMLETYLYARDHFLKPGMRVARPSLHAFDPLQRQRSTARQVPRTCSYSAWSGSLQTLLTRMYWTYQRSRHCSCERMLSPCGPKPFNPTFTPEVNPTHVL